MPMLPSRHFLSETDAFLRDYLRAHPETVNRQKEGLRLWWTPSSEAVSARCEMDNTTHEGQRSASKN